jgi:epoxyqueuosine reductase QueG
VSIREDIESFLKGRNAALVGFADLTVLPGDVREGLPRGVSFALRLTPSIIAGIKDGPTREYAGEYSRRNEELNALAGGLAEFLRMKGHKAVPRAATVHPLPEGLVTPLPQKTVATRAGLGWIGKCALLITPEYGPAVRFNYVLTDAPFPTAMPVTESRCRDCRICVDICPGKAPRGKNWKAGMAREEFFDAEACLKGMEGIAASRGLHICGLCVANCPHTLKSLEKWPKLPGAPLKTP